MIGTFRHWLAHLLFGDVIEHHANAAAQGVRNNLANDAWWFSHDEPTMQLLHELAAGKRTVSDIRESWHKATGKGRPGIDRPRSAPLIGRVEFPEQIDAPGLENEERYARATNGTWREVRQAILGLDGRRA